MTIMIFCIFVLMLSLSMLLRKVVDINFREGLACAACAVLLVCTISCSSRSGEEQDPRIAAERQAVGDLITELSGLPSGPVLLVAWPKNGGDDNPLSVRLKTLKKLARKGQPLVLGGSYVEGMDVKKDFVRFDPLNLEKDIRKYLDGHSEIVAVVVLHPLIDMSPFKGMKKPPFYLFADTYNWEPFMESGLVRMVIMGSGRSRRQAKEEGTEDLPYEIIVKD